MIGRSQGIGWAAGAVAVLVMASGCGAGVQALGSSTAPGGTAVSGSMSVPNATTGPGSTSVPGSTSAPDATTVPAGAGLQQPGSCHVRGSGLYVLPDPNCTPGALNPSVTQADIHSTICTPGWTRTVRPPESYTEPLKYSQLRAYGETGRVGAYEEDHLVPLELGGSPTDVRNLWPEPGSSPNPKDPVENAARRAVCDGRMTLGAARQAMASDWITFGRDLGVK